MDPRSVVSREDRVATADEDVAFAPFAVDEDERLAIASEKLLLADHQVTMPVDPAVVSVERCVAEPAVQHPTPDIHQVIVELDALLGQTLTVVGDELS